MLIGVWPRLDNMRQDLPILLAAYRTVNGRRSRYSRLQPTLKCRFVVFAQTALSSRTGQFGKFFQCALQVIGEGIAPPPRFANPWSVWPALPSLVLRCTSFCRRIFSTTARALSGYPAHAPWQGVPDRHGFRSTDVMTGLRPVYRTLTARPWLSLTATGRPSASRQRVSPAPDGGGGTSGSGFVNSSSE